MSGDEATVAGASNEEAGSSTPAPHGYGPLRVLVLGLVAALLIGSTGYVVSVALDPDPPIGHTMCVDSSCTFAMSADAMTMTTSETSMEMHKRERSAPERFVRGLLSACHLR